MRLLADDPTSPGNAPEYHTGKPCIERGCNRPAGTAWSPFWCQKCNAERLRRISESLRPLEHPEDRAIVAEGPAWRQQPGEPT